MSGTKQIGATVALLTLLGGVGQVSAQSAFGPRAPFSQAAAEAMLARDPARFEALQKPQPLGPPPPSSNAIVNPSALPSSPWTPLANPVPFNPGAMILLTDGSLMIQDQGFSEGTDWWRFTPDIDGDYVNGTWTQLASIPSTFNYAPQYFASAVLPDGRVLIEGGEYNFGNLVWTNKGAIYNPVTNHWTKVAPPNGGGGNWVRIGDAPSTLLADGTFMMGASGFSGTKDQALFDPSTLTWVTTGSGKADGNGEEGWSLLPNGDVLTVDVDNPGAPNTTNSEIYSATSGTWSSAGGTLVQLWDSDHEIGPQTLTPNGTVYAFGASPHNALYDTATGAWSAAVDFPIINGKQYSAGDGAAAVLPNGKVLIATSPDLGKPPLRMFLFDGAAFSNVPAPPNAATLTAFDVFMIVLPTGQVLYNDRSGTMLVYSPTGKANAAWLPTITSVKHILTAGKSYTLTGTQLAGLDQGASYGDDYQPFTNYPLVRITMTVTGHVFYARTKNTTSYSVAPGAVATTTFTVPAGIEPGTGTLVVVANGIASKPVKVTIGP